MTNQEILEKAISKAIDGGWDWPDSSPTVDMDKEKVWFMRFDDAELQHWPVEMNIYEMIFDHDFAKALWGDFGDNNTGYYPAREAWDEPDTIPHWQYRLQQMVIADDPIAYLGEHS